ncbi:MAG: hypothetical protein JNM07_02585 [Phycisphaerae bacterium]|nr:hypothetical protein [Phycisphaerae bacterium]
MPAERDQRGHFKPGSNMGEAKRGSNITRRVRNAVKEAASQDDVCAIMQALIKRARAGDVQAAREVFDRLFGRPDATSVLIRLDQLEERFSCEFAAADGPPDR